MLTTTDQLGRTTTYQYDNLGRKTATILPDPATGKQSANGPTTYYGYDLDGNLKYTTSPSSSDTPTQGPGDPQNTTWYFYDALNRQTCVIDALAGLSLAAGMAQQPPASPRDSLLTAYDAVGDVTSVTDEIGRITQYQYDRLGRMVYQSQPYPTAGPWPGTTYTYDAVGNLRSTTDPSGNTTWSTYDALGRQTRSVDALGSGPNDPDNATVTTYDAVGNILTVTDTDDNVTRYKYQRAEPADGSDSTHSGISLGDPSHTTFTLYDADGNVVQTSGRRRPGHAIRLRPPGPAD